MKTTLKTRIIILLSLLAGLSFASCSKKKSDDKEKTSENTDTGTLSLGEGINASVPKDLAVTSVTTQQSSSSIQAGTIAVGLLEGGGEDYFTKKERIAKVLTTTTLSECMAMIPEEFNLAQGNIAHSACFGPELTYKKHPDVNTAGSIGNGDLGMFWDYGDPLATSGEACSTSVVNNLMNNVAGYSDAATGFQAMIICAGRIGGAEIPAVGAEVDMTSHLTGLDTSTKNFTLTAATIKREEDTTDGFQVLLTSAEGTLKDVARDLNKTFKLKVRHIPTAEGNKSYKGVLTFLINEFEGSNDLVLSIQYKWSDKQLHYRYRQTQVAADSISLDAAAEVSPSDEGSGWTEVVANTDISGLGKVTFVWKTFDALVFNVLTKADGTGEAYFGHTPSDTAIGSDDFYKIKGLRCFPINDPNAGGYSSFVQKQTLALNKTTGVWELNASNIKFAPTSTCSWNTANDSGENAEFSVFREESAGTKVEEVLTFPREHDLSSMADYSAAWTSPTVPTLE